jgi:hypothetical protein
MVGSASRVPCANCPRNKDKETKCDRTTAGVGCDAGYVRRARIQLRGSDQPWRVHWNLLHNRPALSQTNWRLGIKLWLITVYARAILCHKLKSFVLPAGVVHVLLSIMHSCISSISKFCQYLEIVLLYHVVFYLSCVVSLPSYARSRLYDKLNVIFFTSWLMHIWYRPRPHRSTCRLARPRDLFVFYFPHTPMAVRLHAYAHCQTCCVFLNLRDTRSGRRMIHT